jgi:hypothetical protein
MSRVSIESNNSEYTVWLDLGEGDNPHFCVGGIDREGKFVPIVRLDASDMIDVGETIMSCGFNWERPHESQG